MINRAYDTSPTLTRRQIPAIGQLRDAEEVLFVGALLWSVPDDVLAVLKYISDDDIEHPALRCIVAVIREVVGTGTTYTPTAVLVRLERRDGPRVGTTTALNTALTSGAASCPEALRDYAAVVISGSLRRCLESGGHALQTAAEQATEGELAPLAGRVADNARNIADRLQGLRGEAL